VSYCRFSSDDYGCDAYVYEDTFGGFTIHLAGRRYLGDVPKTSTIELKNTNEFLAAQRKQMIFLNTAETEKITLEYAGQTFNTSTAKECAEGLIRFKSLGYKIPQYAIDSLLSEL